MPEVRITENYHPIIDGARRRITAASEGFIDNFCSLCFTTVVRRLYGSAHEMRPQDASIFTGPAGRGARSPFVFEVVVLVYSDDWWRIARRDQPLDESEHNLWAEAVGRKLAYWLPEYLPFSVAVRASVDGYWTGEGERRDMAISRHSNTIDN